MKIIIESLALTATALVAGSAMAQTVPRQGPPSGLQANSSPDRVQATGEAPLPYTYCPTPLARHRICVIPPSERMQADGASAGPDTPERAGAVSTTRSNITGPSLAVDPGQPEEAAPVVAREQRQPRGALAPASLEPEPRVDDPAIPDASVNARGRWTPVMPRVREDR